MARRRRRRGPERGARRPLEAPEAPEATDAAAEVDGSGGLRRAGRFVGMAGGGVALVVALAIGLFPTHTFLTQRADTAEARQRLAVLRQQNASFEKQLDRLGTNEEIERLAREQYNLAFPGEEAYAVLPAPLPAMELPSLWPFGPLLPPPSTSPTTPVRPSP